jgi:hypothetical protein
MPLAIAALSCPNVIGSIGAWGPFPFPLAGASMSMNGLLSSNLLRGEIRYEQRNDAVAKLKCSLLTWLGAKIFVI